VDTFDSTGPIVTLTAAANANAAAAAAVQVVGADNVQSTVACVTNADATNDAIVGWGQTAAAAAVAAGAGSGQQNCFYLLHNTQVLLTIGVNQFFTAILVAGTPAIKVQAGIAVR